jgi:hypothetical protein
MIDLRDFALENVFSALIVELPHTDRGELKERAEGLIAIAEAAGAPIEELIAWIHADAPTKEWSLAEFRAYCRQRPPEPPRQASLFGTVNDAAAFDPK